METAGKLVEEAELREALKEKGLGTPATRAAIIETLLKRQYIIRQKKTPPGDRPRSIPRGTCTGPQPQVARAHRRMGVKTQPDRSRPNRARKASCKKLSNIRATSFSPVTK